MFPTTQPLRLLLIDDHPLVRAGIAAEIASVPGFEVAWQAGSLAEGVRIFEAESPDVTLLDVVLPDGSGLDALRSMLLLRPTATILMLTGSMRERDRRRAREEGAAGYLGKTLSGEELAGALARILRGEAAFADMEPPSISHPLLSRRELETLRCVRQGMSNREIGAELGISERTARAHVESIMNKLNASDRAQAVARGFELELLRLDG